MSHHGGHGYPITKQMRLERRLQAEEIRKESGYDKLSTKEKLDRVISFISVEGRGVALKQRTRLENLIKKEQSTTEDNVKSELLVEEVAADKPETLKKKARKGK